MYSGGRVIPKQRAWFLKPASDRAVTQKCYIKTADSEVAVAMQQFERSLQYAPNMHLGSVERKHLM
jgi:hypothetical protein